MRWRGCWAVILAGSLPAPRPSLCRTGTPTVIVQNMPAAGSLAASNLFANTAPKDGRTIALIQRGMLLTRLVHPGAVRFEIDKLNWIGSLASEVGLTFAWYTSGTRALATCSRRS
jgi:hypothetical protein